MPLPTKHPKTWDKKPYQGAKRRKLGKGLNKLQGKGQTKPAKRNANGKPQQGSGLITIALPKVGI